VRSDATPLAVAKRGGGPACKLKTQSRKSVPDARDAGQNCNESDRNTYSGKQDDRSERASIGLGAKQRDATELGAIETGAIEVDGIGCRNGRCREANGFLHCVAPKSYVVKKYRAGRIVVTIASKVQHAAYFRQIRLLEEQIGQRNHVAKTTTSALTRFN
jgi:hypothetical protein